MLESDSKKHGKAFPCAIRAWQKYEQPLLQWLFKQTGDKQLVQDILQDVFVKVMNQQATFCDVRNTKAWLFRVAKNLLIDHARKRTFQPINSDVEEEEEILAPVDLLALSCLPRVISELSQADREIITACDLEGVSQQSFANNHGLTLAATKSRIRRAREKLKQNIQLSCQVKLDENQQVCCFTRRD
ncbi:sigma-70 family RNA polymerase sigma factor [Vibrio algarum]|uniref:RNA polymerase sigma factor n=1 Tax=Vibrio algarum TaxID=3020714 RepID=A0ABT4YLR1_9VIBR|nr:sigma-70 family RNA polymerase sigma factor [Vibrio sp. KJ40-1]MDB1122484.1 sigma-70 family RNA polymerase sigma factor [Vibrio sp. KJ40-1]